MTTEESYFDALRDHLRRPESGRALMIAALKAPGAREAVLGALRWDSASGQDLMAIFDRLKRKWGEDTASYAVMEMLRQYKERELTPVAALACAYTIARRHTWHEMGDQARYSDLAVDPADRANVERRLVHDDLVDHLIRVLPRLRPKEREYLRRRLEEEDFDHVSAAEAIGIVPPEGHRTPDGEQDRDTKIKNSYVWSFRLLKKVRRMLEGKGR